MRQLAPDAVDVTALPDYYLRVLFSNGEIRLFHMVPLLKRKCYAVLKNPELFNKVYVEYGTVTWPGNIDIDPEWLYEDSASLAY